MKVRPWVLFITLFTLQTQCKKAEAPLDVIPNLRTSPMRPGNAGCFSTLTENNTLLVVGMESNSTGNILTELDLKGNVIMSQHYASPVLNSTCMTSNASGIYILGYSTASSGDNDFELYCTDKSGAVQWSRKYGSGAVETPNTILSLKDGSLLMAGYSISNSTNKRQVFVVHADKNGNELWAKHIDAQSNYVVRGILENSLGEILIITNNPSPQKLIVHKISPDGLKIAEYSYPINGTINSAVINARDEVYGAGTGIMGDVLLVKLTSDLNKVWEKELGKSDHTEVATSIAIGEDGVIGICGYVFGNNTKSYDALYIKTNMNGDPLLYRGFGGESTDQGLQIILHPDGSHILLGLTYILSQNSSQIPHVFFTMVDPTGKFK